MLNSINERPQYALPSRDWRDGIPLISLLLGACWRCEYQAKVGVGGDDNTTVPVHWAPANCPACGLVSVNVADQDPGKETRCHECDAAVELYNRVGALPEPRDRQPCPSCGELTLAFSPVDA